MNSNTEEVDQIENVDQIVNAEDAQAQAEEQKYVKEQILLVKEQVLALIKNVTDGITTIKAAAPAMGKHFVVLRALHGPRTASNFPGSTLQELATLWKQVSSPHFESQKNSEEYKKRQLKLIEDALRSTGRSAELSDEDVTKGPTLFTEKKKKEKKVRVPKVRDGKVSTGIRDRTAYTFNGQGYGKGKLVLAVLKAHVAKNPNITLDQMKKAFPDELLKGYGIFQTKEKAIAQSPKSKRFFLKDDQLIRIKGASIAICNQFSTENIKPFLVHAKGMGFQIT